MVNFENSDFNPRSINRSHKNIYESLIDPNKRLLVGDQTYGMREFFNQLMGNRVIALSLDSSQVSIYEKLMLQRVPIFSGQYKDTELLLTVPGARTRLLSNELKFLARDISNYSGIFQKFGQALHDIESAGYGLPEPKPKRSLLSNFAFSSDSENSDVGNIYLIPPFLLNKEVSIEQEFNFIRNELDETQLFQNQDIDQLMVRLGNGFYDDRN